MTHYCSKCGNKMEGVAVNFCGACGNPLNSTAAAIKNQPQAQTNQVEEDDEDGKNVLYVPKIDKLEVEITPFRQNKFTLGHAIANPVAPTNLNRATENGSPEEVIKQLQKEGSAIRE